MTIRRIPAVLAVLLAAALAMAACGKKPTYEDGYRKGAAEGYRRGAIDAVGRIEGSADQFRDKLRRSVQKTLMLFASATAFLTLFGDGLAERARSWAADKFKIPPGSQAAAALLLYAAAGLALLLCGLVNFGFLPTLPVLVLVSAGLVPLAKYMRAVGSGDGTRAKAAVSKMKSLLFLASAALIVFALLSKAGFMGIRIC